jgi:hypothetical protein
MMMMMVMMMIGNNRENPEQFQGKAWKRYMFATWKNTKAPPGEPVIVKDKTWKTDGVYLGI